MRKLIVEEWISLDGFAADNHGELDFFPSTKANKYSDQKQLQFLETVDTMLLGSNTYKLFVDFWPSATTETEIIADKLNSLTKVVVSNTLKSAPWGKWKEAEVISGNAAETVSQLKNKAGKDIILWGSISLAQTLIRENMADELRINLCPVILGGGKPLFPAAEYYKNLELIETRYYDTGVTYLHYKIKK